MKMIQKYDCHLGKECNVNRHAFSQMLVCHFNCVMMTLIVNLN